MPPVPSARAVRPAAASAPAQGGLRHGRRHARGGAGAGPWRRAETGPAKLVARGGTGPRRADRCRLRRSGVTIRGMRWRVASWQRAPGRLRGHRTFGRASAARDTAIAALPSRDTCLAPCIAGCQGEQPVASGGVHARMTPGGKGGIVAGLGGSTCVEARFSARLAVRGARSEGKRAVRGAKEKRPG